MNRSITEADALRAVLMVHAAEPWDDEKQREWERIVGPGEATTKTLCAFIRARLAEIEEPTGG